SAASSSWSEAMPWLSWFEENRNARSSNPSSDGGQRSTVAKRSVAGSSRTAAWTRFLPSDVRASRRTADLTPARTARTLVQRPHVAPRGAQPGRAPREHHGRHRRHCPAREEARG